MELQLVHSASRRLRKSVVPSLRARRGAPLLPAHAGLRRRLPLLLQLPPVREALRGPAAGDQRRGRASLGQTVEQMTVSPSGTDGAVTIVAWSETASETLARPQVFALTAASIALNVAEVFGPLLGVRAATERPPQRRPSPECVKWRIHPHSFGKPRLWKFQEHILA